MNNKPSEDEIQHKARCMVAAKKGFYIHALVFLAFCVVIYGIWRHTETVYPWFLWPILGWGSGVLLHFLGVSIFSREMGWERKQIEGEVARLRKRYTE